MFRVIVSIGNLFLSEKVLELSKLINTLVESYFLRPMSILYTSLEILITGILLI